METKGNNDAPSISQPQMILFTVVATIVMLTGIGLIYWLMGPSPPPSSPEETRVSSATDDWPHISPTFTLTPSPTPRLTPTFTATPTPEPTPTPIVVGWRELGYLTSVEFTTTTVVELERKRSLGFVPLGGDQVLLMAVGEIQAGIDMSQIKDSDVKIAGTSVKIVLPPAIVTSVELLPGETQIFDSQQSWFLSEYEGLEVEALDKARTQLKDWAVSQGNLLNVAEKLARLQLEDFLRQLGFENIEIVIERRDDL